MISKFNAFIRENNLLEKNYRILLAISGGIDSVVMAELFHKSQIKFGIAHCNFELREDESDEDERFVTGLALKYKVPCFTRRFDTLSIAHSQGISIQMAARELRYAWFETIRMQENFDLIATAHHLDDQVETFFINLIRGTGIAGLHGIPLRQGNVIRPLLFAYRKDITEFALSNELHYRSDSSNATTKYLRNKIRHELIPVINEMNPDFSSQLSTTIKRIADIEWIVDQTIQDWQSKVMKKKGSGFIVDIHALINSEPLMTLSWELLSPFGFNQSQVGNIISCIRNDSGNESSKIFLSTSWRLIKNRQQLIIQPLQKKAPGKKFLIQDFKKRKSLKIPIPLVLIKYEDPSQYEIPISKTMASFDGDKISFPLCLRKWEPGDVFYPYGLNRKKKLSDFYIDQKFSLPEKENCWLLCSEKKILWIIGHRIDHRFRITSKTKRILNIMTTTMPDT